MEEKNIKKPKRKKRCVSCRKPAEINVTVPFCAPCFIKHFDRRVERVVKKNKLAMAGDKILMAVSAGKDSLSCAHVLSKMRQERGFMLGVLHMDVGILECTSERSENVVREFCRERDIPFHFIRFREYLGADIVRIANSRRRTECSVCGAFKRYALNRFARENGYNKLATGHCADDIVRFFFKNWLAHNFSWIAKSKPMTLSNHPLVVSRIRPLFETTEAENLAYTKANNIVVAGCSRCSYFLRNDKWNDIFRVIDEKDRLFKIEFARGLEMAEFKVSDPNRVLNGCRICGEPTDKEMCVVCRLKGNKADDDQIEDTTVVEGD